MKRDFPLRRIAVSARLTSLALLLGFGAASAAPNACPTDAALEVAGLVKSNSARGSYLFSESAFLALDAVQLVTATAWTPRSEFTGPELSTVLAAAGVSPKATEMRFYAIDAYEITIPITDLTKYRPVMAHTQNGKRLEVATRGPLFLVYPRDQYPELTKINGQAQFVWMVCKIVVQ